MIRVGVHKLLEPIISGMNKTIFISSIITVGLVHTLLTCNTLWLQYNKNHNKLTVNGTEYVITAVAQNVSIEITHPTVTPAFTEFDLPAPFFFHGTIKSTNSELTEIKKSWDKLPMIYLHDPTKENSNNDQFSSIDREAELDLYFLAENDFSNWTNEDHENKAVTPMRNLANSFLNEMDARADLILPEFDFNLFNRVRWGTEETTGTNAQFFTESVSGIQMKLNCSFKRADNCEC